MENGMGLYRPSMALLTDLYQLTMAYGYWKSDMKKTESVFHLFFRENPFGGGYAIACGLQYVIDFIKDFRLQDDDIAFLRTLTGNDEKLLFDEEFLTFLSELEFSCDVDAIPEGTVVFPQEPLLRVTGPLIQCQLLETALLNMINFQTLIATKASRICIAAQGDPVLEFGLRRAQGIDGALTASRAAYIGGCTATSNVLAGKMFGIPVKGTHAHSWIMSFDTEMESFRAYAAAMPNNTVFLVDSYNTLEGVKKAITVGHELRKEGYEMAGIRLDSGDLAYLSIEARKLLDAANFTKAVIVASNDLDEKIISRLKKEGATIGVWGVGTNLITAKDQPALGGVYKLSAIREAGKEWQYRMKFSDDVLKISNPGILQVRRFEDEQGYIADVIYHQKPEGEKTVVAMVDPIDKSKRHHLSSQEISEDLLKPIFRKGKLVYKESSLEEIRTLRRISLKKFQNGVKSLAQPENYSVGLEKALHELKINLMKQKGLK